MILNKKIISFFSFTKISEKGFGVIELVISLFILSLFLLISLTYFQKYQKNILIELTSKKILETVSMAKNYAINERKTFFIVFEENSVKVLREEEEIVGKEYVFPERIHIKEKSAGCNPIVLQPNGTSKMAGFLILEDTSGGKEVRIVLHNLTGRCFIEK